MKSSRSKKKPRKRARKKSPLWKWIAGGVGTLALGAIGYYAHKGLTSSSSPYADPDDDFLLADPRSDETETPSRSADSDSLSHPIEPHFKDWARGTFRDSDAKWLGTFVRDQEEGDTAIFTKSDDRWFNGKHYGPRRLTKLSDKEFISLLGEIKDAEVDLC